MVSNREIIFLLLGKPTSKKVYPPQDGGYTFSVFVRRADYLI
ncbi:hypothetical protein HMPREF9413_3467 [Paenibacillus sp. HGF7]|nr:hypothetical protein HMPREF9413_3467 [Paenibacillus sp. HGF7]